jgi:hypothetical protein
MLSLKLSHRKQWHRVRWVESTGHSRQLIICCTKSLFRLWLYSGKLHILSGRTPINSYNYLDFQKMLEFVIFTFLNLFCLNRLLHLITYVAPTAHHAPTMCHVTAPRVVVWNQYLLYLIPTWPFNYFHYVDLTNTQCFIKAKSKVLPRTGHKVPEESRDITRLFLWTRR